MGNGIWEQFTAYNPNKHSRNPGMIGGNHSNIGGGKATYIFADEYREKKIDGKGVRNATVTTAQVKSSSTISSSPGAMSDIVGKEPLSGASSRKGSLTDEGAPPEGLLRRGSEVNPNLVDISSLTQSEFERLKNTLRKGAPNNRVNF